MKKVKKSTLPPGPDTPSYATDPAFILVLDDRRFDLDRYSLLVLIIYQATRDQCLYMHLLFLGG